MAVQPLGFGQKLPSAGGQFIRLKTKGESVQFKIAQEPVYDGKHFTQLTGEGGEVRWEVTECPRIASGEECDKCNKYFELMAMIKKFKAAENVKDDHPEVKRMRQDARPFAVSIQHYFPVLNRNDGKFAILQITNGTKNKFNAHFENGIDVMAKEWILKNTGSKNPQEVYSLSMVDSADVKPLSEDEEKEWDKAKAYDLSQISSSGSSDEVDSKWNES